MWLCGCHLSFMIIFNLTFIYKSSPIPHPHHCGGILAHSCLAASLYCLLSVAWSELGVNSLERPLLERLLFL